MEKVQTRNFLRDIAVFSVLTGRHTANFSKSGAETALRGKTAGETDLLDGIGCAFQIEFSDVGSA